MYLHFPSNTCAITEKVDRCFLLPSFAFLESLLSTILSNRLSNVDDLLALLSLFCKMFCLSTGQQCAWPVLKWGCRIASHWVPLPESLHVSQPSIAKCFTWHSTVLCALLVLALLKIRTLPFWPVHRLFHYTDFPNDLVPNTAKFGCWGQMYSRHFCTPPLTWIWFLSSLVPKGQGHSAFVWFKALYRPSNVVPLFSLTQVGIVKLWHSGQTLSTGLITNPCDPKLVSSICLIQGLPKPGESVSNQACVKIEFQA